MTPTSPRRVAIVGSGVSGLVAAHLLAKNIHVTLYEADARLGGHADTHRVDAPEGPLWIDTGFIVHNERTYPTLLRIFDELGVPTQPSDMSMSVRDDVTGLEYAGARGVRGLFASRRNLVTPRFWWMLVEVIRFHRRARVVLADEDSRSTLAEFLDAGRFSTYFRTHFATPLVSCVWSCDPAVALDYPARYLFTFLEHHGMLTVFGSPTWRTVTGGSRTYVERIAAGISDIRLDTLVTRVAEVADGVRITDGAGASTTYDAVVIATHPDQALAMLSEPTLAQREVLGAFEYSANIAQLHTDTSVLPRTAGARASWNYQRRTRTQGRVLVSYDLSRLMRLPGWDGRPGADPGPRYLVTLNGIDAVDPDSVLATREYAHPIYNSASVAAQARLSEIDTERILFAGAYHGWGFHEDGALSGQHAAEQLGFKASVMAAPVPPARYRTTIRHTRLAPLKHSFTYHSSSWLVDLDQLPRRGFEARDHIGDPTRSLRENLDAFLAEHGIDLAGGRVRMLTQPRSLGYVFNPITVYWCDRADGTRAGVVVEVHNTYGGRHAYLVHPDERGHAEVGKRLYVSPFNDTSGGYTLVVPEPDDRVHVAVTLHREGHPPFVATLKGSRTGSTRPRPSLSAHLVMARIRWQGIGLWLRRLPLNPRPKEDT